jgi:hypothetical protein
VSPTENTTTPPPFPRRTPAQSPIGNRADIPAASGQKVISYASPPDFAPAKPVTDPPGQQVFRVCRGILYFTVLAGFSIGLFVLGVISLPTNRGSAVITLIIASFTGWLAWTALRATIRICRRRTTLLELY